MSMRQQRRVVVAATYSGAAIDASTIRSVRKNSRGPSDRIFFIFALLSIAAHFAFMYFIREQTLPPPEVTVIEQIPERFARLIVEKPIPKTVQQKKTAETADGEKGKAAEATESKEAKPSEATTSQQRKKAKTAVAAHTARVEKKIRTVGVLGMLTGVGATAKGPSVVDVLGSIDKKDRRVDLEAALDKMTGLQKTREVDVLEKKLVKSKDVAISHKEDIDDLLANVGKATTVNLSKKGSFVIQKPESIEGAASSNAKRDNDAINAIVASHKTSIRMSYEKYLKRDPVLAGKITVRFTIASSGRIAMVRVVENTTGNKDLENEIIRKIRMWRFASISEGDVTVTYPFVFAPAG